MPLSITAKHCSLLRVLIYHADRATVGDFSVSDT